MSAAASPSQLPAERRPLLASSESSVSNELETSAARCACSCAGPPLSPRQGRAQCSAPHSQRAQQVAGLRRGASQSWLPGAGMKEASCARFVNIRTLGALFFVLASCYCLYKIVDLLQNPVESGDADEYYYYGTEFKLANVYGRHGDRSPSEELPEGDAHKERMDFFWPNGKTNLIPAGQMRQYRLGAALRRRYADLTNSSTLDPSQLLAFSSGVQRCLDSAEHTLRGFFSLEQGRARGLRLAEEYSLGCFGGHNSPNGTTDWPLAINSSSLAASSSSSNNNNKTSGQPHMPKCTIKLSDGAGSPNAWKEVPIDKFGVPTLDWHTLADCRRDKLGLSPIDDNLWLSAGVAKLDGARELSQVLKRFYKQDFNYRATDYWSVMNDELKLDRTRESIGFIGHFAPWIGARVQPSAEQRARLRRVERLEEKLPSMYDVLEALNLYVARDRIEPGLPRRVQLGPMLSSLIDSQQVALAGQQSQAEQLRLNEPTSNAKFANKRVLLHFTHDTVLQLLMFELGLIREQQSATKQQSYLERFVKAHGWDRRRQFLSGLRMAEFGATLTFELFEAKRRAKRPPSKGAQQGAGSGPEPAAGAQAEPGGGAEPGPNGTRAQSFAYVTAALYLDEQPLGGPISFEPLELGTACRQLFRARFPQVSKQHFERLFYAPAELLRRVRFNPKLACPFELFRNVTMQEYAMSARELAQLCAPVNKSAPA